MRKKTQWFTPYIYQEPQWGEFSCPQCLRERTSRNRWANKRQECRDCFSMVYPTFVQVRLRTIIMTKDEQQMSGKILVKFSNSDIDNAVIKKIMIMIITMTLGEIRKVCKICFKICMKGMLGMSAKMNKFHLI